MPRKILYACIAILAAIYPLFVYFSLNKFGPQLLALILLVVLFARLLLMRKSAGKLHVLLFLLIAALCVAAMALESEKLLKYYPVLMNLGFAAFFLVSLKAERSLIEQFAGFRGETFEPHQISYMRGLCIAWALLLVFNAAVSSYTACCSSLQTWALYNGLVAYCVFAVFVALELIYRQIYKKRFAANNA